MHKRSLTRGRPQAWPKPAASALPSPGSPDAPSRRSTRNFGLGAQPVAISILLAGLVAWVFLPSIRNGFINLDDPVYVYQNPHLRGGLAWENIGWAFGGLNAGFWHPLTWLSLLLDSQLFGMRPGGYHLTSLLFHAANSVLLFLLFRRMTGAVWRSAFVAALFALHPLHVEPVAWVSSRKDVLSTFFGLLSLIFYVRYAQGRPTVENRRLKTTSRDFASGAGASSGTSPSPCDGGAGRGLGRGVSEHSSDRPLLTSGLRPATPDYLLALFFFACGLMSKTMVVTLPFIMLLMDWWPLRRFQFSPLAPWQSQSLSHRSERLDSLAALLAVIIPFRKSVKSVQFVSKSFLALFLEKLPFLVAAFLAGLLTMRAEQRVAALPTTTDYPLMGRIANAILSCAGYPLQMVWPAKLAVHYPYPPTFMLGPVLGAAIALLAVSALVLWAARARPSLFFGWIWYVITLLPVLGFIQVGAQSHADRYTYLPLIGLFVLLAWGASDLTRRLRFRAALLTLLALAVFVPCTVLTRQQITYWRDSETLFRHTLAITKDNVLALNNLGSALARQGRLAEAIDCLHEAVRLNPDYSDAQNNLGAALARVGRFEEAIAHLQTALKLDPGFADAENNLGGLLLEQGRFDEAISHLQEAVRLEPDDPDAHFSLAGALARKGLLDEAVLQYQQAARLNPASAETHSRLGKLLGMQGRLDEAVAQFQQALELNPDDTQARCDLGITLVRQERFDEALSQFQQVLKAEPDNAEAHYNLGVALGRKGRLDEAIVQLKEALRLKPGYSEALDNLRIAQAMKRAAASPRPPP